MHGNFFAALVISQHWDDWFTTPTAKATWPPTDILLVILCTHVVPAQAPLHPTSTAPASIHTKQSSLQTLLTTYSNTVFVHVISAFIATALEMKISLILRSSCIDLLFELIYHTSNACLYPFKKLSGCIIESCWYAILYSLYCHILFEKYINSANTCWMFLHVSMSTEICVGIVNKMILMKSCEVWIFFRLVE